MAENSKIDLDTPFFQGSAERIHQLPVLASCERLGDLVQGQQISASSDGQTVVVIHSNGGKDQLTHSRFRLPSMSFEPAGDGPGTRIIEVSEFSVLLWGKPASDRPRGVYLLTEDRFELKDTLDELLEVRRAGSVIVVLGRCQNDETNTLRAITPFGTVDVPVGSIVTPLASGNVQIVRTIGNTYYRYEIGPDGFTDVCPVFVKPDEQLIGLAQMHGLKILCLSGEKTSRFVGVGQLQQLLGTDGVVEFQGRLERVWQSPSGKSIAWLIRRTEEGLVKRTLCLNGRAIYDGHFRVHSKDLHWSPNEQQIGVRISSLQSGSTSQIITPTERLVLDSGLLEDFLVDDQGHVAARLMFENGEYTPFVYNLQHDTVPFAWNLTWSEGEVRYNSVNCTSVLATNDRTHCTNSAES